MATIFTDGTIYIRTKVNMINQCLLAIGETPLPEETVIDDLVLGTDADVARRLVETTMVEVQSRGWYFNTDYDFPLLPDVNNFISLPPSVLRIDTGNSPDRNRYIEINSRVYDLLNKTYVIPNPIIADVIWLKDYEELPPEAYEYISLRAARKFQQRVIGSSEISRFTELDEADALINLQRRQLQINDYTMRNEKVSTRTHNGYLRQGLYQTVSRRPF